MRFGGRYWLFGIGVAIWTIAGWSWADGCFFGKGDMREPEQKAVILFAEGMQDLIIQVQYDCAEGGFAWLVPLPSQPEVAVSDGAIFAELLDYTYARSKWQVEDLSGRGPMGGFGLVRGGAPVDGGVNVLERKRVGVYDVAVLEADTAEDLVRWCEGHGYMVSAKAEKVLATYVDRGWVFTAMRIHPEVNSEDAAVALEAGTIDPIRFTFPTDEAIYPLRISSINRGATDVLVYVLAEDTLVHPAFAQRHAPPLDQFERLLALSGSASEAEWRERFNDYFDESRYAYRHVGAAELEHTRGVFSRWGKRALYLTALQQTFKPEEMEDDVVFKAPEQWDREAQMALIVVSSDASRWLEDPLILRMPEALAASLGLDLARDDLQPFDDSFEAKLRLALQLEGARRSEVLLAAVRNANPQGCETLARQLERVWFTSAFEHPGYDQVIEGPQCAQVHQEYKLESGEGKQCHHQLSALPGARDRIDIGVLAELFRSGKSDPCVAKMLAALNTGESIALLIEAARGALDPDGGRARNSRQEMALMALRHNSSPELAGLYQSLYAKHRDSLNEREVASCLVGLWTLNDPATDTLVRQFEGLCLESQMPSAAAIARNLLINRLRTREPIVHEDMHLANLEREMGGRGVIVNRLMAGDEEVIQYRWETGVATVKSDVVVKWKPVRN